MSSTGEIHLSVMPLPAHDRARILGVEIDRLDMDATVRRCAEIIESGGPAQHVAVNVAKTVAVRDDDRLRAIVEGCDLVSVDGMPVVWASRILGDPLPERRGCGRSRTNTRRSRIAKSSSGCSESGCGTF